MSGLGEDKGLGSSASQWKPVLILSPAQKSQPVEAGQSRPLATPSSLHLMLHLEGTRLFQKAAKIHS